MIDTPSSTRRIAHGLLSRRSRAWLGRMTGSSKILRATLPARRRLASQAGDTLIEVIVSALLVALIVVGTFSGLDSTNKATALQRSRSQADALAEQNEEQLRSAPIKKLYELEAHPETTTVAQGNTKYTVETRVTYIEDKSATASCNSSSSSKADYLQTTSKVTWPSIGAGKAVEESGVISPPAGSTLIVQVTESGTALQGATVTATGPAPETTVHTLETSASGCAIFALLPGEYGINASSSGYVDPNGYANTDEDSSVTQKVYIAAETTAKEGYYLGRASKLAVSFTGGTSPEGDTFVVFNTGQSSIRQFGTAESYGPTVSSPTTIYPFKSKDTVYAGSCEADLPTKNGIASNPEVEVLPGTTTPVTVKLGPVKIKVMSGYAAGSGKEGSVVSGATGSTQDGCGTKRSLTTNSTGALSREGLPFGEYTFCVGTGGGTGRRFESTFKNNSTTGPAAGWTNGGGASPAIIYLGTSPSGTPTKTVSGGTCP
jgi:Tfp pilus assembly protein PilX